MATSSASLQKPFLWGQLCCATKNNKSKINFENGKINKKENHQKKLPLSWTYLIELKKFKTIETQKRTNHYLNQKSI
jgi:hypothetical protein